MTRDEAADALGVEPMDVWLIRRVNDGDIVYVMHPKGIVATRVLDDGRVGRGHHLDLDGFWRERYKAS